MAFPVEFYTFEKRPNSTARPVGAGVFAVYGDLKESSGIISPQIRFNLNDSHVDVGRYNYAYIRQFYRFYFIEEWTFEHGFWIASMKEDCLASWRDEIGALDEYVVRAAQAQDGNIIDYFYPAKTSVSRVVNKIDWGEQIAPDIKNGTFVIGVLGNGAGGQLGAVSYFVMADVGLARFMEQLTDSSLDYLNLPREILTTVHGTIGGEFLDVLNRQQVDLNMLKAQFNPMQYISSCMWLPIVPSTDGSVPLKVGFWEVGSGLKVRAELNTISVHVSVPKHPLSGTRGNYLNVYPFTRYTLYAGAFGVFPIDSIHMSGVTSLDIDVSIDPMTGLANLFVNVAGHTDAEYRILQSQCQIGIPVNLAQIAKDYLGMTQSVVGGTAAAASQLLKGDIAGGIMTGLSAIGSATEALMPEVRSVGTNGSIASQKLPWLLEAEFMDMADDDREHRGRPLCQYRNIKELGGYIMVADADVHLPATKLELDTIKSFMERGFYWQ